MHTSNAPRASSAQLAQVAFHKMTGEQFDAAQSGVLDKNYKLTTPAWLNPPRLKYYMRPSFLHRSKDTRVFFIATAPMVKKGRSKSNVPMHEAVAMLEVDFEYADTTTVGLKYVTVHEGYRENGMAMRLYEMLIQHLQDNRLRLYRTRPGLETPAKFTAAVTRVLTERQVNWYSRDL